MVHHAALQLDAELMKSPTWYGKHAQRDWRIARAVMRFDVKVRIFWPSLFSSEISEKPSSSQSPVR